MVPFPIFLTAEWRHLIMVNFEVDPELLLPLVPKGTELDLWEGKAFMSLVGFLFLNTKIKGISIPFHRNFEEFNLRFYVKRTHPEGDRRGAAFIKEIVPKPAIAYVARKLYNENYIALPMRHLLREDSSFKDVKYEWKLEGDWQHLAVKASKESFFPKTDSIEEFIAEHYWGYTKQRDGGTVEYQVSHPKWAIFSCFDLKMQISFEKLYGSLFAPYLQQAPHSLFLAEGSEVSVSVGRRICTNNKMTERDI